MPNINARVKFFSALNSFRSVYFEYDKKPEATNNANCDANLVVVLPYVRYYDIRMVSILKVEDANKRPEKSAHDGLFMRRFIN